MNKLKILIPLALTIATNLYSQEKTQDYKITMPEEKVLGSLYSSIDFLDSRYDTSNFGIVQLGAFNRKAQVITKRICQYNLRKY